MADLPICPVCNSEVDNELLTCEHCGNQFPKPKGHPISEIPDKEGWYAFKGQLWHRAATPLFVDPKAKFIICPKFNHRTGRISFDNFRKAYPRLVFWSTPIDMPNFGGGDE